MSLQHGKRIEHIVKGYIKKFQTVCSIFAGVIKHLIVMALFGDPESMGHCD